MSSHLVRDAEINDVYSIASQMRECDRNEIAAASGVTPEAALFMGMGGSYQHSLPKHHMAKTGLVSGIPILMFGVTPSHDDSSIGIVWMLATDHLEEPTCRRILARHSRGWVEEMQAGYRMLTNRTDKRNKAHHRWLKWCGFTFINEVPVGPCRAPFLEFVRIKHV